ncbi:hypothetical protein I79_024432 [Cricetulus griseus]|uniref:Uncharacterized protein n=1 Tax=Cricetulus griseus TaxID=10029 RepID=G3IKN0_CRIGR|nr:hypothetical protein I79_024432 [Cricetulus griseus]
MASLLSGSLSSLEGRCWRLACLLKPTGSHKSDPSSHTTAGLGPGPTWGSQWQQL